MSVSYGGTNLQAGISQLNNQNLASFNLLQQGEGTKDQTKEGDNLARLGGYTTAIGEKYKEYQDFVKEGGDVNKLKSVKLAGGIGDGISSVFKSEPLKYTGPDQAVFSSQGATNRLAESDPDLAGGPEVAPPDEDAPVDVGAGGPDATPPPAEPEPAPAPEEPTPEPEEPDTPGEGTTETTVADNSTVEPSPDPAEGDEPSTLRTIEEGGEEGIGFAGKVAKVGGAVFSAGMLGDDIYNQVKDKSFFYGENTGDKVGNFMNELGSAGDVLGLATGDPLLVLAGVGLGAVGSVVSDVSELFSHHTKQTDAGGKPPATIGPSTAQNIAGTGGIAETTGSSLRSVQMGGS